MDVDLGLQDRVIIVPYAAAASSLKPQVFSSTLTPTNLGDCFVHAVEVLKGDEPIALGPVVICMVPGHLQTTQLSLTMLVDARAAALLEEACSRSTLARLLNSNWQPVAQHQQPLQCCQRRHARNAPEPPIWSRMTQNGPGNRSPLCCKASCPQTPIKDRIAREHSSNENLAKAAMLCAARPALCRTLGALSSGRSTCLSSL